MKSEKGSVTLFVLVVLMLITIVVIGFYMLNTNRISDAQINKSKIEKNYSDTQKIDQIYENVLNDEKIDGGENEN